MSITGAFLTSQMGLATTGTRAELTSSNIANADRPGYVRREAVLISGVGSSGVRVAAIARDVDSALQSREWTETAVARYHQTTADGLAFYTSRLGAPGDPGTLPMRIADLQTSFDLLSVEPGNTAAQAGVLRSAEALAQGLNDAAGALGDSTARAYDAVEAHVADANRLMERIASLNEQLRYAGGGQTAQHAELLDQRDAAIAELAGLVDLRQIPRSDGTVDIMTDSGTALVEGQKTVPLTYDRATKTLEAGGVDLTPGGSGARGLAGGALAAEIELAHDILPEMGRQLDELAGALVQTFEAADATLAPGDPGLFTDAGSAYDPLNQEGLAARIAVNSAVDPDANGALYRIRDGVNAAAPGATSDATQVLAFIDGLSAPRSFAPERGLGETATLTSYASGLVSAQNNLVVEARQAGDASNLALNAVRAERSAREGVNVDHEIQDLLQIEQAYAANSQVISALTRMLDDLMQML
jgi:flagellar hook-associated protein 1 FlgK